MLDNNARLSVYAILNFLQKLDLVRPDDEWTTKGALFTYDDLNIWFNNLEKLKEVKHYEHV